jgi:hypothetical protein
MRNNHLVTSLKSRTLRKLLYRSAHDDCVKHYVKNVSTPISILHCGAHLGEEYKNYKDLRIKEVFWNEAQPSLVLNLEKQFGSEYVFPGVVTDQDNSLVDFYLTDNSLSSSTRIINPNNQWDIKIAGVIKVKTITLDTILRKIQLRTNKLPQLIVLDLQGGELEALLNCTIAFTNQLDFDVEISKNAIYENQKTESEVIEFFENLGYKLVYPKKKKAHYDALFLAPKSSVIYFYKFKILKRFLSEKKSKFIELLYTIKRLG